MATTPHVLTVNVGRLAEVRSPKNLPSGIGKVPADGPIEVRAPGRKRDGLGSGLVGDELGDRQHHGGDTQAVYAYAREELDHFAELLGRDLPNGAFGENLTTTGLTVSEAVVGERWRVGETLVLQMTAPRTPCSTFRAWIDVKGWLRTFTRENKTGAYLAVVVPGPVASGDTVEVISRPDHGVRVSDVFLATMVQHDLLPGLLVAGDDLEPETREAAERAAQAARDAADAAAHTP